MDYLSNLKNVKSVIASVFRDNLCVQGSNMKYTKFGDEIESQEDLNIINNDLITEMLDGEKINYDLGSLQAITLYSDSDSSFGSEPSVSTEKGNNFLNTSAEEEPVMHDTHRELSYQEDLPTRLVITYHFSFDIEDDIDSDCEHDSNKEDVFENYSEDSFCSDKDLDVLEYSSVKNGSKNNLLDCDFDDNLRNGVENVGLVDYDSYSEVNDSVLINNVESNDSGTSDLEYSAGEECNETVSSYCGNPSKPCMRNGFIYYSSEIRLYQGELRYDDTYPEKRFNLARKLFRKVFPSQKYVLNA